MDIVQGNRLRLHFRLIVSCLCQCLIMPGAMFRVTLGDTWQSQLGNICAYIGADILQDTSEHATIFMWVVLGLFLSTVSHNVYHNFFLSLLSHLNVILRFLSRIKLFLFL